MSDFEGVVSEVLAELDRISETLARVEGGLGRLAQTFKEDLGIARNLGEAGKALDKFNTALGKLEIRGVENIGALLKETSRSLKQLDTGKLTEVNQQLAVFTKLIAKLQNTNANLSAAIQFNSGDLDRVTAQIDTILTKLGATKEEAVQVTRILEAAGNRLDLTGVARSVDTLAHSLSSIQTGRFEALSLAAVQIRDAINSIQTEKLQALSNVSGGLTINQGEKRKRSVTSTSTGPASTTTTAEPTAPPPTTPGLSLEQVKARLAVVKEDVAIQQAITEAVDAAVSEPVKRKPGRPKKAQGPVSEEFIKQVSATEEEGKTRPAVEERAKKVSTSQVEAIAQAVAAREAALNALREQLGEILEARRILAKAIQAKTGQRFADTPEAEIEYYAGGVRPPRGSEKGKAAAQEDNVRYQSGVHFDEQYNRYVKQSPDERRETGVKLGMERDEYQQLSALLAGIVDAHGEVFESLQREIAKQEQVVAKEKEQLEIVKQIKAAQEDTGREGGTNVTDTPGFSSLIGSTLRDKLKEVVSTVQSIDFKQAAHTAATQAQSAGIPISPAIPYLLKGAKESPSGGPLPDYREEDLSYDPRSRTYSTRSNGIAGANDSQTAAALEALRRAIEASPSKTAIFATTGGMTAGANVLGGKGFKQGSDHVGLAYQDAEGIIRIMEHFADVTKFTAGNTAQRAGMGHPLIEEQRTALQVAGDTDVIQVTPLQASEEFALKLREAFAEENRNFNYSFGRVATSMADAGKTCASALADAADKVGPKVDRAFEGVPGVSKVMNTTLPQDVLEHFQKFDEEKWKTEPVRTTASTFAASFSPDSRINELGRRVSDQLLKVQDVISALPIVRSFVDKVKLIDVSFFNDIKGAFKKLVEAWRGADPKAQVHAAQGFSTSMGSAENAAWGRAYPPQTGLTPSQLVITKETTENVANAFSSLRTGVATVDTIAQKFKQFQTYTTNLGAISNGIVEFMVAVKNLNPGTFIDLSAALIKMYSAVHNIAFAAGLTSTPGKGDRGRTVQDIIEGITRVVAGNQGLQIKTSLNSGQGITHYTAPMPAMGTTPSPPSSPSSAATQTVTAVTHATPETVAQLDELGQAIIALGTSAKNARQSELNKALDRSNVSEAAVKTRAVMSQMDPETLQRSKIIENVITSLDNETLRKAMGPGYLVGSQAAHADVSGKTAFADYPEHQKKFSEATHAAYSIASAESPYGGSVVGRAHLVESSPLEAVIHELIHNMTDTLLKDGNYMLAHLQAELQAHSQANSATPEAYAAYRTRLQTQFPTESRTVAGIGEQHEMAQMQYLHGPEEVFSNVGATLATGNERLQAFFKELYGPKVFDKAVAELQQHIPELFSKEALTDLQANINKTGAQWLAAEALDVNNSVANLQQINTGFAEGYYQSGKFPEGSQVPPEFDYKTKTAPRAGFSSLDVAAASATVPVDRTALEEAEEAQKILHARLGALKVFFADIGDVTLLKEINTFIDTKAAEVKKLVVDRVKPAAGSVGQAALGVVGNMENLRPILSEAMSQFMPSRGGIVGGFAKYAQQDAGKLVEPALAALQNPNQQSLARIADAAGGFITGFIGQVEQDITKVISEDLLGAGPPPTGKIQVAAQKFVTKRITDYLTSDKGTELLASTLTPSKGVDLEKEFQTRIRKQTGENLQSGTYQQSISLGEDGIQRLSASAKTLTGINVQAAYTMNELGKFELETGHHTQGLSNALKEMGQYISPTMLITNALQNAVFSLQAFVGEVINLQKSLTDVNIILDGMNSGDLKDKFLSNAISAAADTGNTAVAGTTATSDAFKQLGSVGDMNQRVALADKLARIQLGGNTAFGLGEGETEARKAVPAIFSQLRDNVDKSITDPAKRAEIAMNELETIFDKTIVTMRETGTSAIDIITIYTQLISMQDSVGGSTDKMLSLIGTGMARIGKTPEETGAVFRAMVGKVYNEAADPLRSQYGIETQRINKEGVREQIPYDQVIEKIMAKAQSSPDAMNGLTRLLGGQESREYLRKLFSAGSEVTQVQGKLAPVSEGGQVQGGEFQQRLAKEKEQYTTAIESLKTEFAKFLAQLLLGSGAADDIAKAVTNVTSVIKSLTGALGEHPEIVGWLKTLAEFLTFRFIGQGLRVFSGLMAALNALETRIKGIVSQITTMYDVEKEALTPLQKGARVAAVALEQLEVQMKEVNSTNKAMGQTGTAAFSSLKTGATVLADEMAVVETESNAALSTITKLKAAARGLGSTEQKSFIPSSLKEGLAGAQRTVGMLLPAAGFDLMTGGANKENFSNIGVGIAGGFIGSLAGPEGTLIGYMMAKSFSENIDVYSIGGGQSAKDEDKFAKAYAQLSEEQQKQLVEAAQRPDIKQAVVEDKTGTAYTPMDFSADMEKLVGSRLDDVNQRDWAGNSDISKFVTGSLDKGHRRLATDYKPDELGYKTAQIVINLEKTNPAAYKELLQKLDEGRQGAPVDEGAAALNKFADKVGIPDTLERSKYIAMIQQAASGQGEVADKVKEEAAYQERTKDLLGDKNTLTTEQIALLQTTDQMLKNQADKLSKLKEFYAGLKQTQYGMAEFGPGGSLQNDLGDRLLSNPRGQSQAGLDQNLQEYDVSTRSLSGVGQQLAPAIEAFNTLGLSTDHLGQKIYDLGPEGQAAFGQIIDKINEASAYTKEYELTQAQLAEEQAQLATLGGMAGPEADSLRSSIAGNQEKLVLMQAQYAQYTDYLAQMHNEPNIIARINQQMQARYQSQLKARDAQIKAQQPQFQAPSMMNVQDYSTDQLRVAMDKAREKQEDLVKLMPEMANEFKKSQFLMETKGGYKAVTGVNEQYFQQALQEQKAQIKAPETVDLRNLSDEQYQKTIERARALQAKAVALAPDMKDKYDDERLLVLRKNNDIMSELGLSQEFLRIAMEDNTEVNKDQLRGHYNLPGGYTPPTVWDYYSEGGKTKGDVNYPGMDKGKGDAVPLEMAKQIAEAIANQGKGSSKEGPDLAALGDTTLSPYKLGYPSAPPPLPPMPTKPVEIEIPDTITQLTATQLMVQQMIAEGGDHRYDDIEDARAKRTQADLPAVPESTTGHRKRTNADIPVLENTTGHRSHRNASGTGSAYTGEDYAATSTTETSGRGRTYQATVENAEDANKKYTGSSKEATKSIDSAKKTVDILSLGLSTAIGGVTGFGTELVKQTGALTGGVAGISEAFTSLKNDIKNISFNDMLSNMFNTGKITVTVNVQPGQPTVVSASSTGATGTGGATLTAGPGTGGGRGSR